MFLAVHQELEEDRVIKRIAKENVDYPRFLKEAHLLRDLRHPGIPMIYDLTEDEDYCYLIEEYLQGDTLQAVVSTQGPLSQAMMVQYGIQICHLVSFLHSRTTPILFLDLHPGNLLLCCGTIKLVDPGQAIYKKEAGKLTKRYGAIGYAAPEQYTDDDLDERTDLYAIGAVLYYLHTGTHPEPVPSYSRQFFDAPTKHVLRRCLAPPKAERFSSVDELEKALQKLAGPLAKAMKKRAVLSLTIAVTGAKAGVGTTHAAIGLSAYLLQCGISCCYEEKNPSGAIRQTADWFGLSPGKDGCVQIKGLSCLPGYGPAVSLKPGDYSVGVQDYGTAWTAIPLHQADAVILICGSRWWEQEAVYAAYEALKDHPNLILIYNHISGQRILLPPGAEKARCFPMPFCPDPFRINYPPAEFYQKVLVAALPERKELTQLCCGNSFFRKIKERLAAKRQKPSAL